MAARTPLFRLSNDCLQPSGDPGDARTGNGAFGASKSFPAGCVIGRKTSDSLLYPCPTVNQVQTITATGTATAGVFTLTIQNNSGNIVTTSTLAFNASIATIQTALDTASGVANGIVASSAGTAAPFSTPTPLILTFSGTNYSALDQVLATMDISLLTGVTAYTTVASQPNTVQTITFGTVGTAGSFAIRFAAYNGTASTSVTTAAVAFNASISTIQTALDNAAGVANSIVASSASSNPPWSTPTPLILTFSGTNYAGNFQPLVDVEIDNAATATIVTVQDTTITADGSEKPVGFVVYPFKTDASGNCYFTTVNAVADLLVTPQATMPYYRSGTFDIADLIGWNGSMLSVLRARILNSTQVRIP